MLDSLLINWKRFKKKSKFTWFSYVLELRKEMLNILIKKIKSNKSIMDQSSPNIKENRGKGLPFPFFFVFYHFSTLKLCHIILMELKIQIG